MLFIITKRLSHVHKFCSIKHKDMMNNAHIAVILTFGNNLEIFEKIPILVPRKS